MKRRLVFGFFLCTYLLTMGGHFYSIDDEIAYRLTERIANAGHISVVPLGLMPRFAVAQGKDGRWYTSKGLGLSLLALPVVPIGVVLGYVVSPTWLPDRFIEPGEERVPRPAAVPAAYLQRVLWSFLNVFVTALTCTLLFDLALRFGFTPAISFCVTAMYGLGTMAWIHATHSNFPEPLLALCTLAAFYGGFRFVRGGQRRWLVLCGVACGYGLLTKITAFGIVPVMALYLWMGGRRRDMPAEELGRVLREFAGICGIFLAVVAWYNYSRFGSPFETGYGLEEAGSGLRLQGRVVENLAWLFFSWGKGLLFYATPSLLFFVAFRRFARQFEDECIAVTGVGLVYLLTSAAWYDWEGGLSWGPRLVLPMVALWTLPAGFLLQQKSMRLGVGIFCGLGLLVQLMAVPINWMEAYNRASGLILETPAWHAMVPPDAWLSQDHAVMEDAIATLIYFHFSWSPMVGNLRVLADGSWDLFWISSPPEYAWHGVVWAMRLIALGFAAGAVLCLRGLGSIWGKSSVLKLDQ